MKHKLLMLLLASIIAPAWAGEIAALAPTTQTTVAIHLSGSAQGVRALLAGLEKDPVYEGSGCSSGKPMAKSAKTAKIICTNASGALLEYLIRNTPSKVRWSISSVTTLYLSSCLRQTCSGATGCYLSRCGAACPSC